MAAGLRGVATVQQVVAVAGEGGGGGVGWVDKWMTERAGGQACCGASDHTSGPPLQPMLRLSQHA